MCGLTRENAAFELALTLPRVDRVKWTITMAGAHLELIIFEATKSKKVKKKKKKRWGKEEGFLFGGND